MSQFCGRGIIARGAVLPVGRGRPQMVVRPTRSLASRAQVTSKGLYSTRRIPVESRRGLCVVNVAAREKQSTAVDTKVGIWDLT